MKKVVLVLGSNQNSEVIRYKDMLKEFDITGVVCPSGMGLEGRDAGCLDGGRDTGIKIQSAIDYSKNFEGVLLEGVITNKYVEQAMSTYIREIIRNEKKLYFLYPPTEFIKQVCRELHYEYEVYCREEEECEECRRISEIQTPIIVVCGLHEYTRKFAIQLELLRYFERNGYHVSLIGTKAYGQCFGIHALPSFLFHNISEKKKILGFHKYVKRIENKENPDVIILGIPGGIAPYSEKFPGYFGITMYEIMQAVSPDAVVLSCLYENYNKKYFEDLQKKFFYTYGINIDCFHISTFQVDSNESDQTDQLQYIKLTYQESEKIKNAEDWETPVYNIGNGIDGAIMCKQILDTLLEYSDAELV